MAILAQDQIVHHHLVIEYLFFGCLLCSINKGEFKSAKKNQNQKKDKRHQNEYFVSTELLHVFYRIDGLVEQCVGFFFKKSLSSSLFHTRFGSCSCGGSRTNLYYFGLLRTKCTLQLCRNKNYGFNVRKWYERAVVGAPRFF